MEIAVTELYDASELLRRAKLAGFEVTTRSLKYFDSDEWKTFYLVFFPEGSSNRPVSITSQEKLDRLLSIDFERYSFIDSYMAVADLEKGYIEAAITSGEGSRGGNWERQLGAGQISANDDLQANDEEIGFLLRAERSDGLAFEISKPSIEFSILGGGPLTLQSPTLKLDLKGKKTYDLALKALRTISNSLFFKLDLERGISIALRKDRRRRRQIRPREIEIEKNKNIEFPTYEYDEAPISLYWYAKSAREMPLLQFLAYYQVVEYYFNNFSKLEAIRIAQKIIKNPGFRVDREAELTKLVSAISGLGRVGTGEREQMRVAIMEILSVEDVSSFFRENEEIAQIVGKKQKGITEKTINIHRKDHDHRADISELLYDIRCRIVHTKNGFEDSKFDMILPYSSAEEQMWAYIELMQFVAQHALIRSSSVLGPL
jgi:hypothetical protein